MEIIGILLVMTFLFRRQTRGIAVVGAIFVWIVIGYFLVHYEAWVACGRPTTRTCLQQKVASSKNYDEALAHIGDWFPIKREGE